MFSATMLLILGGCALGAIQLVGGIAIGLWLRRSEKGDAGRGRHEIMQAGVIAKRLQALADEMSSSAHEHRTRLDHASRLLASGEGRTDDALAQLVVDVIGDVVRANQDLQSQLETAESRLEEQAIEIEAHISRSLTDPLTGLPNRREFNDRLEERMSAWNRRREVFSLLLLDVDHFKKLNDEHGHLAGDQVLAAIGRALRGAMRREDAVARYGGEEFAILMPNTSLDEAVHVAEKVRSAVAQASVDHNGKTIAVTMSGGLAAIGANDRADSLIGRADAALYSAKESGRNRTCVHDGCELASASGPAARLVELIHLSDGDKQAADSSSCEQVLCIGSYLPREIISPELAQTCEELRQVVAGQRPQAPAASTRP
jgi:diguanylate cyclase